MNDALKTALAIVLACAVVVVICVAAVRHDEKACAEKGGHLVFLYKSELCVDADGRILE